MPGLRPSSALAARPAACQRLYVQRFWRWTDRPGAEALHASTLSGGGGKGEGGVMHGQKKNLSRRRHSDKSVAAKKYDFTPGGMREHVAKVCLRTVWAWSKAWWDREREREPEGARLQPLMRRLLEALKNGEEDGVGFRFVFFFFLAGTTQGEARFTRQAIFERLVEPEGGVVAFWYRLKVHLPPPPPLLQETMRKQSSALIDEWGVGMAIPNLLPPPLLIPNPKRVCRDLINHYWPWWNGSPPPPPRPATPLTCHSCLWFLKLLLFFFCVSPQFER